MPSEGTISQPLATAIVWGDLLWVVGTIPVVMAEVLNPTGDIAAVVVAVVVLDFALLQYLGLRRVRRLGAS